MQSIMPNRLLRLIPVGIIVTTTLLGCGGASGPQLGHVYGTITINDEPVPGVRVVFVPEGQGSPSYGATDQNGNYRLFYSQNRSGAQLGKHHVLIETPAPATDEDGNPVSQEASVKVPTKYQQPGILVAEVSPGSNYLDFELEAND